MTAYYNEIDPFAAQWLRNLIDAGHIAPGDVDTRSITEVQSDDIKRYTQVHLFAGIGGWSLALRLAGWPDDRPVWSGSCPCQPFSSAGKQRGTSDERHLWPEMFRLVRECRPPVVIGEQVSIAIGHGWLDGVCDDLEGAGYACGSVVLGAFSVGAPYKRSRLYWVANNRVADGKDHRTSDDGGEGQPDAVRGRSAVAPGDSILPRLEGQAGHGGGSDEPRRIGSIEARPVAEAGAACAVGMSNSHGPRQGQSTAEAARYGSSAVATGGTDAWSDFRIIACLDGNARRVGRGVQPLAHGLPRNMGRGQPELFRLARRARGNRVGRLKGYGNAIVPQVAAEFVRAYMECAP